MTVRELVWEEDPAGGAVRVPRFCTRLPFALESIAQCALAVAQRVEQLVGVSAHAVLSPPAPVTDQLWRRIREGARTWCLQGECADATVVVDERSCARIAAAAFGEDRVQTPLSGAESRIVQRCIAEIARAFEGICGTFVQRETLERDPEVYCEVRLGPPLDADLGIALARRRAPPAATLGSGILEECPIECSVALGTGSMDFFTLAALGVGDVVRLETKVGALGTLNLGAEPIAAGEGGVLGDRTAFKVHELR